MQDDDQLDSLVADPELDVIEQAEVPFLADDMLLAAMGSDGEVAATGQEAGTFIRINQRHKRIVTAC